MIIKILEKFLNILSDIEDGKIDQHEGSYIVGLLLKKLMKEPIIFDLRNIYNETEVKDMGIEYHGVGK